IDNPFPGLSRQQQRHEAFDPVAALEDDLAYLRVRQHDMIDWLMLPEAHLEADRAAIEIGPPYALEEFHRVAFALLHAAAEEIAAGSGCIEDDESHHIGEVSHRPLH